jgi:hypothetical protein
MKIAAIDPGLTGAAVVLEQIGGAVMLISAIDLPIMGDGAKRRLDAFTFARWLSDHAPARAGRRRRADCTARQRPGRGQPARPSKEETR